MHFKFKLISIILLLGSISCKKQDSPENKQILINFETNGGTPVKNQLVKSGATIVLPNNPEKNVWHFDGWYKDVDYKEKFDINELITSQITLYAKWKPGFKSVNTLAGDTRGFNTSWGNTTGYSDGYGDQVHFWGLGGICKGKDGTLWINEYLNRRIRKITPVGQVITVAGTGRQEYKDGFGTSAAFEGPGSAMATDSKGNLFIFDNNRLRKIAPSGEVTTIAGNGIPKAVDGKGTTAGFWTPGGMVFDAEGNIILTEWGNSLIRKITPDGTVTTLCRTADQFQFKDGLLANAGFRFPQGICIDSKGDLYIADQLNNCIRKISNGIVSTFAGSGEDGYADGIGRKAKFSQPTRIVVDKYDNLYVAETLFASSRLRMISPDGEVFTVINGNQYGFKDGLVTDSKFNIIRDIALDDNQNLYVMDDYNSLIRMIKR